MTTTAKKAPATMIPTGAGWNTPGEGIPMEKRTFEIMFTAFSLATNPNNKQIYSDYIASRAPEGVDIEDEIAALGEDEYKGKQLCIFKKGNFYYDEAADRYIDVQSNDTNLTEEEITARGLKLVTNVPFVNDYQWRGMFKDSCGLLNRAESVDETGKKTATTESSKLKAYKKVIDGGIFVYPRRIAIQVPECYIDEDNCTVLDTYDEDGKLTVIERPLRISGPTGERSAIASSEMVPVGSTMKFTVGVTNPKFWAVIEEWLNYGAVHGFSGWRNSGAGTFVWRMLKDDYTPYTEEELKELVNGSKKRGRKAAAKA